MSRRVLAGVLAVAAAAAAGTAAVSAVSAAVAEARRLTREPGQEREKAAPVLHGFDGDAWIADAAAIVHGRLAPGEHALSVTVLTEAAGGSRVAWVARPGDTGPVIRKTVR